MAVVSTHGYAPAHHGVPKPGDAAEVYSDTAKQWISATVIRSDRSLITLRYKRNSESVEKTLPWPCETHLRLPPAFSSGASHAIGMKVAAPGARPLCKEGIKCKVRQPQHLVTFAHPFDPDYRQCCSVASTVAEAASLRNLFTWVDADGSGKISPKELQQALPLLEQLQGEPVVLTKESWEALDEDGNGAVNFFEFAQWAGPRLGLPLGIDDLFEPACGVNACPCHRFRPLDGAGEHGIAEDCEKSKKDKKEKKDKKKKEKKTKKEHWHFVTTDREADRLQTCKCGHKQMVHRLVRSHSAAAPFPCHWGSGTKALASRNEIVQLDMDHVARLQELVNSTYRNIWTRDRRKHHPDNPNVPTGFRLSRAYRFENGRSWQEFSIRRAELLRDAQDRPMQRYGVMTGKTWAKYVQQFGVEDLAHSCNEWILFHGTSPAAALAISRSDFRIDLAGGSTGTLYGRGTYFAESFTKADEYAKAAGGEYAMLLVRALGGHVRYCDEVEPDAEDLTQSCIEGPYDCVLGDRQKCRGTYREFIFFDTENMYPEYILIYKRIA